MMSHIDNEHDYQAAKQRREGLEKYLSELRRNPPREGRLSDPRWLKMEQDSVQSLVDELTEQVSEYQAARMLTLAAATK